MEADSDRLSQCTAATTASLASRLASLAVHYPEAGGARGARAADETPASLPGAASAPSDTAAAVPAGMAAALSSATTSDAEEDLDDQEGEEEIVELSEAAILAELDALEPAWCVASRLFKKKATEGAPPPLKRLTWTALDALCSRGYAVVDGVLTEAEAGEVRAAVLAARDAGALVDAASAAAGAAFPAAPGARSDAIAWLPGDADTPASHPALRSPAIAAARAALADVAADVGRAVRLALPPGRAGEVQVAAYPPGGRYVRHRDALPDDGGGSEDGEDDEGLAQRRVTVVLYANPGWRADHGGKLRLWPPVGLGDDDEEEESEEEGEGPARAAQPAASAAATAATVTAATGAPAPSSMVAEPTEAASDVASLVGGGGGGGPTTPRGGGAAAGVAGSPLQRPPTTVDGEDDGGDDDESGGGTAAAPVPAGGTAELGPEAAVDMAPLAGRAVLFMSGAVEHAVLAAGADRVALTAWLR